jgi:hypothetical protein
MMLASRQVASEWYREVREGELLDSGHHPIHSIPFLLMDGPFSAMSMVANPK